MEEEVAAAEMGLGGVPVRDLLQGGITRWNGDKPRLVV
jgi:hypothetical protein